MGDVVSVRLTKQDISIIDRTARTLQAKSKAEAIRYLIRKADERAGPLSEDPVWTARAPKRFWLKRSLTSQEIDAQPHGGEL